MSVIMKSDAATQMSCTFCSVPGIARCSICLSWYCSLACQGDHWPLHRRECVPPPALVLPDGSPFLKDNQEYMVNMNEVVNSTSEVEKIQEYPIKNKIHETIKNDQPIIGPVKDLHISINNSDESKSKTLVDDTRSLSLGSVSNKSDPVAVLPQHKSVDLPKNNQVGKKLTYIPPMIDATKSAEIPSVSNSKPDNKFGNIPESTRSNNVKANGKSSSKTGYTEKLSKPLLRPTSLLSSKDVTLSSKISEPKLNVEKSLDGSSKLAKLNKNLPSKFSNTSSDLKIETRQLPPTFIYPPAVRSGELPSTIPPIGQIVPICFPVLNFVSPFNFGIRLVSDESSTEKMVADMTRHPPPMKQGWKVGRSQTLAVCHEGVWFRGVAVKKLSDQYSIYLLDYGTLVTAEMEHLRPLPHSNLDFCPSNIQVCLAGVGPLDSSGQWSEDVCEVIVGLLNADPDYKLGVEFLGQVEGGRWAVKITGLSDQQDVVNMLVEGGVAVVREDLMTLVIKHWLSPIGPFGKQEESGLVVDNLKNEDNSDVLTTADNDIKSEQIKDKVENDVNNNLKIMRGVLTENMEGGVCYLESPDSFFLCPSSSTEQFLIILQGTQSPSPGAVAVKVGDCCLAQDEGCWYRAEVVRLRGGGGGQVASLFLLDYGKTLEQPLEDMRPLEKFLDVPGLVVKVGLAGVEPGKVGWSEEEIEGSRLLLDVGGETVFKVKQIGVAGCGKPTVGLTDSEGTDVTDLMLTAGIGVKCDSTLKCNTSVTSGPLTYYNLPTGPHKLIIMSADSPALFYLCSLQTLNNFQSTIQAVIDKAVSQAVPLDISPTVGVRLLAYEEETWYRAVVQKVVDSNNVVILLLDMGCTTHVAVDKLRKVPDSLFTSLQVVAVPSVLVGWEGMDEKEMEAKWGDKMGQIVECFDEIGVEVLGRNQAGKAIVRVPVWEGKLGDEVKVSKADQLKLKMAKC